VFSAAHGPRCVAAEEVAIELARHIPRLAAKRKLDPALMFAALQLMPVEWTPTQVYEHERVNAQRLIGERDPDDWPTLALALTLEVPVWSQDKDFEQTGVRVLTTGQILDVLNAEDENA
jgi:predicted nucleic acid-binding protein